MEGILKWISDWYKSQCDGYWEHDYGIKIINVDNPGWYVTIDLVFTELEEVELEMLSVDNAEDDWYLYRIKDKQYQASGDPGKLELLLEKFREIAEANKE